MVEDDAATTIDVLANDTDPDGGPITIDVGDPAGQRDGGRHRWRDELTYQPDPNYCNTQPGTTPDTFTYTLTPAARPPPCR